MRQLVVWRIERSENQHFNKLTSSSVNRGITHADVIANSDTQADSGTGASRAFGYSRATGLQYVQIDPGASSPVIKILVWHYYGDGNRVKGTVAGVTTVYIGNYFEWTGSTSTMKKYYYASVVRVALREGSSDPKWLLADHLSSSTITASFTGIRLAELAYKAWGENRYSYGTTPTTYRYTGQRQDSYINLYWYGSRWYDAYLNRWTSPDSIIPDPYSTQDWDRYSYCRNNPARFVDPTGHWTEDQLNESLGKNWRDKYFEKKAVFEKRTKLLGFLLSKNTTDPITLGIVRSLFNVAYAAHGVGVDFSGVDALGARVTVSGGTGGVGGISGDVMLNLSSGEFSGFISPEGGILIGEGITIVGGITMYSNMPTNEGFRETSKAVGILGGDIIGINAEESWGGVTQYPQGSDAFDGTFIGVGGASPGVGVYGSLAYAIEVLRVDNLGYHWVPNPPTLLDALSNIGGVLWNDILHLP